MFRDREEAGRRLAVAVAHLRDRDVVVLALPRGGVPVAAEVAASLDAPLDVVFVRKLGAPGQPELAAGAVVDGGRTEIVPNEEVVAALGIGDEYLREVARREVDVIEKRRRAYRGEGEPTEVHGRTAVVVDDGIATGSTMRAALRGLRRRSPARLVLAVPVAPRDVVEELRGEVDEVICLETPSPFGAIGRFYERFDQVDDETVRDLLEHARGRTA